MLYDEHVCQICGKPTGDHSQCEARTREIQALFAAGDQAQLNLHARFRAHGVHSDESKASLARATACLADYLGHAPEFEVDDTIEGHEWWFIPHGWIGVIGFIVEKSTGRIFMLGSGLAAGSGEPHLRAHWSGVIAYLHGYVDEVAVRRTQENL